ncbi:hypothetical protein EUTSA_v10022141mg, partial [Eutrema salsugineum]
ILSRVPAVSLARLRSTSKGWNALIKDGRFAKNHSVNGPSEVYLLSVDLRGIHENVVPTAKVTGRFSLNDPFSDSSEEVDIHDIFHCESLLLCTVWIQPRNSYSIYNFYALGYDNKSSCYKILRMDKKMSYGKKIQTEYEIYDLSSNSWRVGGVTTDWFALTQNREGAILLSFDYSEDRFQSLSLPSGDPRLYAHVALSVTRDPQQLCMLSRCGASAYETHFWMATRIESTGAMSWTNFLTLSGTDLVYQYRFTYGISFLFDQENKVVLSSNRPMVSEKIIHIVGEDKYIEVDHHGAQPTQRAPIPRLLSYVPRFVKIQQDI